MRSLILTQYLTQWGMKHHQVLSTKLGGVLWQRLTQATYKDYHKV